MRIDAHQHFWRYNAAEYGWIDDAMALLRRDYLPPELARELASAGFDGCVAVQARQTLAETSWLLALADAHRSIAGVVGWVDLQAGAQRVRAQLASFQPASKLVGVRHIVQTEPDDRFLLRPEAAPCTVCSTTCRGARRGSSRRSSAATHNGSGG
jgi:L-fuconolactonase